MIRLPPRRCAVCCGLPELTGLFLFSTVAFALAALVLFALLRPDPLQIAAALEPELAPEEREPLNVPLRRLLAPSAAQAGLATVVTANFVMVAVMTMAPVHVDGQGHGLQFVGLVVSLHVAGMFAPSPITGRLTDRLGPLPVAAAGAVLLTIAGGLSAAGGDGGLTFALGLILLGVGWNAGLIAGRTLLASSVPITQRPRVEGAGELSMGIAATSATAVAGPIVGIAGYATLTLAGAAAAATLAPFLITVARRRQPQQDRARQPVADLNRQERTRRATQRRPGCWNIYLPEPSHQGTLTGTMSGAARGSACETGCGVALIRLWWLVW